MKYEFVTRKKKKMFFAQHHVVVVKRRQNGRWTNGLSRFKDNDNLNQKISSLITKDIHHER